MTIIKKLHHDESGNALFLILIAVTLFAALSFAVTQSNSGGSGQSVSQETALINSSQITQYPSGIRTGVTRMLIKGTAVSELVFDPPGDAGYTSNTDRQVFHPNGGGVSYQFPTPDTVTDTTSTWVFKNNVTVTDIGTASPEIVAFLPNVRRTICEQINRSVSGSTNIPTVAIATAAIQAEATANTLDETSINGRPFMCFETSTADEFVYFHVLVEQ